ncbi:MAG: undecaprenyl-diphosphate phosphatase [Treponema sp.]|nr:undecaprenyl-diphosphate phosphatase [Treponema sp.]
MTLLQGIFLGILQGVAEFLPISSSGHLAIAQNLFGLDEVPLLFDVFLHLATLAAVCLYFWKKIWTLLKCFGRWICRKPLVEDTGYDKDDLLCGSDQIGRKTIIAIILSTLVTGVMGIVTSKLIPELPVKVICCGFIVTSALLIISALIEKKASQKTESENQGISKKQALFVGFMQGIGTLPGISRSGSTIAGALLCGVNRKAAGEYSFIISIPAILGAFILELKDLGDVSESVGALPLIAGCISAFLVGYLSLALLMKTIRKGKLQWFACYLIPAAILGFIFL